MLLLFPILWGQEHNVGVKIFEYKKGLNPNITYPDILILNSPVSSESNAGLYELITLQNPPSEFGRWHINNDTLQLAALVTASSEYHSEKKVTGEIIRKANPYLYELSSDTTFYLIHGDSLINISENEIEFIKSY